MKNKIRNIALISAALLAGGCASGQNPNPADPWEGFNRQVFQFNDGVDQAILKPAAKGYQWAVPQLMRDWVTNFFSNIGDVSNVVNNLLQAKGTAAAQDLMRIVINSFMGLGGLIDFATPAGLPKHDQDFGQTLGVWGVASGPYLVLPLFGPSTVRDAAGTVADVQISPTTYFNPVWFRNTLYGVRVVNTRANLLGATDLLAQAALDKYSFTRDAYLQRRKYLINGGGTQESLPNYDEDSGAAAPEGAAASAPKAAPGEGAGTGSNPMPGRSLVPGLTQPFRR